MPFSTDVTWPAGQVTSVENGILRDNDISNNCGTRRYGTPTHVVMVNKLSRASPRRKAHQLVLGLCLILVLPNFIGNYKMCDQKKSLNRNTKNTTRQKKNENDAAKHDLELTMRVDGFDRAF
jgi:hypothetical protein